MKAFYALLIVLFVSCRECQPDARFDLSVKLVDGSWTEAAWVLPKDTKFYVQNSQGSYWLSGDNECERYYQLRSAVIDFKVKKITPTK